jgi:hypothetical protein
VDDLLSAVGEVLPGQLAPHAKKGVSKFKSNFDGTGKERKKKKKERKKEKKKGSRINAKYR